MNFPSGNDQILPDRIKCISPRESQKRIRELELIIGSLMGLAVGDALGASVEFRPHQYFVDHPVVDMEGGGTWGLRVGQWTDDTSMALCLASSLIEKKTFNPYDQMVRYKWWFKYGYMSSTGRCFDIGNATRDSLDEFSRRQEILKRRFHSRSEHDVDNLSWDLVQSVKEFSVDCSSSGVAGNGALMRLTPVPLFFYRFPAVAVEYAGRSARLTHGDKKAVDACRYYAALIVAAINGDRKNELLKSNFYESHREWFGSIGLHDEVLRVAHGSFKQEKGYEGGIRGKGYIINALEAALWAFWSDEGLFEKGALAAVNLGDDTDTTAAIYGQLAGACYGYQNIPPKWLNKLYARELFGCIGEWLCFEGKQYNLTENEQQMISKTPGYGKTLSNQPQQLSTHNSSNYYLNTSESYMPQTDEKRVPTYTTVNSQPLVQQLYSSERQKQQSADSKISNFESYIAQPQVHDPDVNSSRTYQRDPKQLTMYHPDNYQSSAYRQNSNQSRKNQSTDEQYSMNQPRINHLAAYYSDFDQPTMYLSGNEYLSAYGSGTHQAAAYNPGVSQQRTHQFSAIQSVPR
jgi:ADP-ribosyl-[dinitrogen reductase] hydrolase